MKTGYPRVNSQPAAQASVNKDEVYALAGLNMVTPDQIIDTATRRFNKQFLGQSPWTINSRQLLRNNDEPRAAIRTRYGSSFAFGRENSGDSPSNVQNHNSLTGDGMFSASQAFAFPITTNAYTLPFGTYCLSILDLQVRRTTGYIESISVKVYNDNSNKPGSTLLAESSMLASSVTTTNSTVRTRFMDAPPVVPSQKVWVELSLVGATTAQCFVKTTTNAGGLTMPLGTGSGVWTATNTLPWFTCPMYRAGVVLGAHRRVVTGETSKTIIANGFGDIDAYTDTGTFTNIYSYSTTYNPLSNKFRFAQVDNYTIFVNGSIQPSYWDGTSVTVLSAAPSGAESLCTWQNRLWMKKGNKISFTDLLDSLSNLNSWPVVNYFYPNTPEDPDYVTAILPYQNNLVVFTRNTKYLATIGGSGISSFTCREVKGTKGALSQECVATDGDFVYFIGADKRMYRFNGVSDTLLSDDVDPEITDAQEPELYSFIHVHRNQVKYYYLNSDKVANDRTLVFDLMVGQWFLDTDRCISRSISYNLEDNRIVEFSSLTSMAYNGDDTGYSDMGKPIDWKYWTNYKAYGSAMAKKRVKRFRPIIKYQGRTFDMFIGVDHDFQNAPQMNTYHITGNSITYGGGAKWGDGSKWGGSVMIDNSTSLSGRAKHIQYRFEKRGANTPVSLYGYASLFNEGRNR